MKLKQFQLKKQENEKVSSFRGRIIRGKDIELPKNVNGFIFENENENQYKTTHQFNSISKIIFFFLFF